MKTLLIMRHAKSSWKEKDLDDIQRPLAKRGLRDSDMMGELITDRELTPQVIFTSSAVRCTQTAALIAKAGSFN
ncbi:MAG: histidine phosphatase family protein, partial [Anaerolineae bacterium]|nr:histidine phosphatase family protein [Anaerolineae bacterium]